AVAHQSLVAQLQARTVERRYLALVWGRVESDAGLIDAPVGRGRGDPTRMAVSTSGRDARTRYWVVQRFGRPVPTTLVECRLETGRTHQVRVHLAAIGHPLVGDAAYGGARSTLPAPRPFLHARDLAFDHPVSGARLSFSSPLPADFAGILATLE
ncbi:MAG: RluA family pseudouridine synthase, partial [Acidimicrobiales bacterium]